MTHRIRLAAGVALAAVLLAGVPARAANEGQDDLDKATQAKVSANTLSDLAEVIRLVEMAQQKGLDKENTAFANSLLSSALLQRGEFLAKVIFKGPTPDREWPKYRQAALSDLERVVKINANQPEALYYIAQLNLLPGGDAKRGAEALETAIRTAEDPPVKAKALVLRAGTQKESEKKLADLEEAVRIAPQDPAARRVRGALLADMGKLDQALEDLNKAIEADPNHPGTYQAQAIVLAKQKKYDDALTALDKLRQLMPDSVIPLIQRARVQIERKDLRAALCELNQAYSTDPSNLEVLLLRAAVQHELGDKDRAMVDLDKILELKPDLPQAMRLRAMLLTDANKLDDAIAQLEKIREADPKDPATTLQLATLYSAQKKQEKAIKIFSDVLAEKPSPERKDDQWIAYRGRGDAYLNSGKHAEAIADYEQAVKLQPKESGILNNFAWVLATSPVDKLRDGKRAVALATQACELTDYKQAHILSTLAAAYAESGDFDSAQKWSQKAIEIGSKEHDAALKKELDSYKAKKAWRELLSESK